MISKTAKGLTPAVSAKPLADDRDERFMVVLLHNTPGVIAEMTSVSTPLNPFVLVVVPFSPTTPQVQPRVRTPPLAAARGRRPVHGALLLGEFLETRTAGLATDYGLRIADCGLRLRSAIAAFDDRHERRSRTTPIYSRLRSCLNLSLGIQKSLGQSFRQFFGQVFRPSLVPVFFARIALANGYLIGAI